MHRCLIAALLLAQLSTPLSAQPGAFEILAKVRQAYAGLGSYRDHGEIDTIVGSGSGEWSFQHHFETEAGAGAFRFLLERDLGDGPRRKVIWKSGGEAFDYDSGLGQYKQVASLPSEVAAALGEGWDEALVVPVLLAGDAEALSDPDAASVDGSEPCGDSTCWVVSLSRTAGTESRLWIDSRSFLIRQVEVRREAAGDVIDRAMTEAGMAAHPAVHPAVYPAAGGASRQSTQIVVHHEIDVAGSGPPRATEMAFTPPAGSRRVEEWQGTGPGQVPEFGDEITVALSTVVVRVVDTYGRPLLGLKPEDFRVTAKGKPVPVVAVDWVSSVQPEAAAPETPAEPRVGEAPAPSAPGKRVVFFVQADLDPSRIKGQIELRSHTRELLQTFAPEDRIAVVSYDSHLKLWQDFTADREAVHEAIDQAMRFGGDRQVVARPSRDPSSLAAHFDFDRALRTASPEKALQVTAEALLPLPGEKAMVYLGYGLGRYTADGVHNTPDFKPAIRALDAARVTVFVLDVTQADYHSLEVGLRSVAYETGGTYSKTYTFPKQATDLLAGSLAGYYVLTLDRATLPAGGAKVRIGLKDRKGTVYTRPGPLAGTASR